jgi:hypothetical protein
MVRTSCARDRIRRKHGNGKIVICAVVIAALASIPHAYAQSSPPRLHVDVEISSSEIERNAALMATAAQVGNAAADLGLDALFGTPDGGRVGPALRRLGQLWLVSMPIASLAQGRAHDFGHVARGHERGIGTDSIEILQWPWPIPIAQSAERAAGVATDYETLAIFGGGQQGSHVQQELLLDRIYSRDHANYFDWVLFAYTQLDAPVYAWWDLRRERLTDAAIEIATSPDFDGVSDRRSVLGDYGQFAISMTRIETSGYSDAARVRQYADSLRHAVWMNVLDYSLWAGVMRVADYVITGDRYAPIPVLKIGRTTFVPGAYANLSSDGPEKGMRLRIVTPRYLPHVEVRWIDAMSNRRLWGVGAGVRTRSTARLGPELRTDVWQRDGKGAGFRFEAGARGQLMVGTRPLETSFRIGYKSEGYLTDAPRKAGPLASVGVAMRF